MAENIYRGGNSPLPDDVKKARGTYQPAKEAWKARQAAAAALAAPKPPRVAVPPPPEDLTPPQARWWPVLARAVDVVGVYTEADWPQFLAMVQAYAYAQEALAGRIVEERISKEGDVHTVTIPATQVIAAMKASQVALTHFGLDPASRDKLIAAPPPPGAAGVEAPVADPDDMTPLGPTQ